MNDHPMLRLHLAVGKMGLLVTQGTLAAEQVIVQVITRRQGQDVPMQHTVHDILVMVKQPAAIAGDKGEHLFLEIHRTQIIQVQQHNAVVVVALRPAINAQASGIVLQHDLCVPHGRQFLPPDVTLALLKQ